MFYLRELQKSDLETINEWRNDHELIKTLGAPFRYINLDVDRLWFDTYMANRGNTVRCSIVEKNTNKVLGLVSLTNIDFLNQSAEFHIMIGDKNKQKKGAGTFATNMMLSHAFNHMNLQRIELTVLEDNRIAQRLYEKTGFIKEGMKRQALYKNGKYVNTYIYSILRSEYNAKQIKKGG